MHDSGKRQLQCRRERGVFVPLCCGFVFIRINSSSSSFLAGNPEDCRLILFLFQHIHPGLSNEKKKSQAAAVWPSCKGEVEKSSRADSILHAGASLTNIKNLSCDFFIFLCVYKASALLLIKLLCQTVTKQHASLQLARPTKTQEPR